MLSNRFIHEQKTQSDLGVKSIKEDWIIVIPILFKSYCLDLEMKKILEHSRGSQETELTESHELLILHAIHDNDYEQLKRLGAREQNLNFLYEYKELSFDRKISPLILASYLGRIECVKLILENPCIDVDLASEDSGYTPLCVACLTGNYEIVKLLVETTAETNLPNKYNQTPLVLCFSRLNEETNIFENTKICFKMIELLLDHGADINWIVDKNKGHTILMQFCGVKMELEEREKRINLEHGADKNLMSNKGKTPMDLCKKHCNQTDVMDALKNTSQINFYGKNKKKSLSITIDKAKAQQALDIGNSDKKKKFSTQ